MVKWIILYLILLSNSVNAWNRENLKNEIGSPFTTNAKNIFWTGTGITLTVLLFEDAIVDPTQKAFQERPLGSWSKVGDLSGQMIPNGLYAVGELIAGANGDKNGNRRAIGMFKATAYASGVTTLLKYTIREERPNSNTRNSFPSGHATAAFAFAGYIYEEHGWRYGVPALALASLVGMSRINDNMHYLHDILAGATIGLAYGVGVSKLDRMAHYSGASERELNVVPIFNSKTKGLAFFKEF